MKSAIVIVNPNAGLSRLLDRSVDQLIDLFQANGIHASFVETSPALNSASDLAREASANTDYVFACGGDGTVHQVAQGMIGSNAILGILPCGTANALARYLTLPIDPVQALRKALGFPVKILHLGEAKTSLGTKLFIVMAGVGPDGLLIEEMNQRVKRKLGRAAYYLYAGRLFLTRRQPKFVVNYRAAGESNWHQQNCVALLVSRIPRLGGLFSGLSPQTEFGSRCLTIQLVKTPSGISLPAWFFFARIGLARLNPYIKTVHVAEVECLSKPDGNVFAQADGEGIGTLPIRLSISSRCIRMLAP